jgi:uncharacterized caspase-like protein
MTQETRFSAFVLGNANYKHEKSFPEIPHCKRDAADVFQILTSQSTGLFDTSTSVCRIDLPRDEFIKELNSFFEPITKNETVLMYFAGHGRSFGQKHFALVMTDTVDGRLAATGFDVSQLGTHLAEKEIKRYVLIFDCCRAGKVLDVPGLRTRGLTREVNLEHLSGMGKWLVASCHDYQNANELETLQHGIFTHSLIEGIRSGKAVLSNDTEFIDVHSICSFASNEISREHPSIGQDPIYSGEDLKGNPVYIARNANFKTRFRGERVLLDAMMRTLKLADFSDEVQFELARRQQLQFFMNSIPPNEYSNAWRKAIALHGEVLGLDEESVFEQLSEFDARLRFERPAGLLDLTKSRGGLAMLLAAGAREAAFTMEGRGGIFGYHLLQALSGSAADAKGLVTIRSAFEFVRRRVEEEVQQIRGGLSQTPQIFIQGEMDNFVLTGKGTTWPREQGKRRALLVGTDRYDDEQLTPLYGVEAELTKAGALLGAGGNFDVSLLVGGGISRENVMRQLTRIRRESESEDCILFYFTGHSYVSEGSDYYLFVSDSRIAAPLSAFSVREISNYIKPVESQAVLMVLDTNYAGFARQFVPM